MSALARDPRPAAADRAAVDRVRARIAAGAPAGPVADLPPTVGRAVTVAAEVGAPLQPALDTALRILDDRDAARRALRVATAQSRAVAGGLLLFPLVLVPGLGRLLDIDMVGFYTRPAGMVVGALAAVLLALGAVLTAVILRRASAPRPGGTDASGASPGVVAAIVGVPVSLAAGLLAGVVAAAVAGLVAHRRRSATISTAGLDELADLTATALGGGLSLGAALRVAAGQVPGQRDLARRLALAVELGRPLSLTPPLDRLHTVVATSQAWGAPAVGALRQLATSLRAEEHARRLEAAERAPAQLTVPTVLCLLPASLLLVGAPLVAGALAHADLGAAL